MKNSLAVRAWVVVVGAFVAPGCSPSAREGQEGGGGGAGNTATATSGVVAGPESQHCTDKPPRVVREQACKPDPMDHDHDHSHGHGNDQGSPRLAPVPRAALRPLHDAVPGAPQTDVYGSTQFNAEGLEDQCKYRMAWESDGIAQDRPVTFQLTVRSLVDSTPAAGADPYAEVFLDAGRPAPATAMTTTETAPGVYRIGPVLFDAPGRWTVRFHVYGTCVHGPESPHGHAAFFVDVP